MTNTTIIEAPEYAEDVDALLSSQHTYNMYVGLPVEMRQALAAGEHLEGFMQAANAEWHRRNEQSGAPDPAPKFLGTVERALRRIAQVDVGAPR